ncbi:hypothetical protein FHS96_003100 [Sphingomonas zeicaulis]|uniref:GPO family capsid scaffolding protein n=1 Tax=Sphingomonas zeicaulis TaxID=1632740 RepID=UPI003D21A701
MAKQSKFFRVAVEGATVDGRKIERSWISDMAATYNRATYAARVNMEHIRGFSADPPFNAYGDVLAVKAEEIELELAGKKEKKLALFAQIEPTDALVQLNGKKQKLYTSIEIQPDFAGTGKAGLVGLAITDSPASLGTEMLEFAASQGDKSPLAARKQNPGNHFSVAEEIELVFEDAPAVTPSESAGLFAAATEFFKQFTGGKAPEVVTPPVPVAPQVPANDNDARFAALGQAMEKVVEGFNAFSIEIAGKFDGLSTKLTALESSIDDTPERGGSQTRKPAAGGTSYALADF